MLTGEQGVGGAEDWDLKGYGSSDPFFLYAPHHILADSC